MTPHTAGALRALVDHLAQHMRSIHSLASSSGISPLNNLADIYDYADHGIGICDELAAALTHVIAPRFPLSFQCSRCGQVPAGDCVIAVGTSAASTDEQVRARLIELGWRAPAAQAQDAEPNVEYRLFDSQWLNVVNHDNCYAGYSIEDAVNKAAALTEEYMRTNITEGKFPLACAIAAKEAE